MLRLIWSQQNITRSQLAGYHYAILLWLTWVIIIIPWSFCTWEGIWGYVWAIIICTLMYPFNPVSIKQYMQWRVRTLVDRGVCVPSLVCLMIYSWFIIIANHGPSAFDCPPSAVSPNKCGCVSFTWPYFLPFLLLTYSSFTILYY